MLVYLDEELQVVLVVGGTAVRPKIAKAREIAELAESENRAMSAEEQKEFDEIMTEGREVADEMKQRDHDNFVWDFARKEFGGGLDLSGCGVVDKSGDFPSRAWVLKSPPECCPAG